MLKKERAPGLGEGEIEHAIWLQTALFVLLKKGARIIMTDMLPER